MAMHHLDPVPRALHGYFSRELAPALTIDSGDVVSFQTLDAGWGAIEQEASSASPETISRETWRATSLILWPVRWQSMAPGRA
jgi:acetamidase/formamidase